MAEEKQTTKEKEKPTKAADTQEKRIDNKRNLRQKNMRRKPRRRKRPAPEFDSRVVAIRRVTRVVAGGRRFSFSVTVVSGDHKGRVGVGVGKAGDTALAIEKAQRAAKRVMFSVPRTETGSIPHEVSAKYASAQVIIFPAPGKGGLTAGSAVRSVLELAGVNDVGAKLLSRTKNKLNIARATIIALKQLQKTNKDTKQNEKDKEDDKKEKTQKKENNSN